MRTKEEIQRAIEVMRRSSEGAILEGDVMSASATSLAWGVLLWVLNDPKGEHFQGTIEACNRHDANTQRHEVN